MRMGLDGDGWTLQGAGEVLPAQVPGVVHLDLLRAGKIADPFFRTNETDVQWVGQRDWVYRRTFELTAEALGQDSLRLVCEGLDTVAELELNGVRVGVAENMFHEHRFDIKPAARLGTNEIAIKFASAERVTTERQTKFGLIPAIGDDRRVWLRKAQYHFGWDWGPRFLTCGIWRPIYIEAQSVARIDSVWPRTMYADEEVAVLQVEVELEHLALQGGAPLQAQGLEIRLRLTHSPSAYEVESVVPMTTRAAVKIEIPRPHLWWPAGYGEAELYDLQVELRQGETVLDAHAQKVGLRTVKLLQVADDAATASVKDADGRAGVPRSFVLAVNGVKVFCRGANWIPADSFLPRVSRDKYEHLVAQAAAAEMNMLRVWGGGIYEDPAFYEACDRRGILIWQDFMFACGYYPEPAEHAWFAELLLAEARAAVKRLRGYACVALWCGNNENHAAHHHGWFRHKLLGRRGEVWGMSIYHELLPGVVAKLDQSRPYVPGSPWSDTSADPSYVLEGDVHRWDVWANLSPVENYREDQSRFMSEFGMLALPTAETIREMTAEGDRKFGSPVLVHHNKALDGTARLRHYAELLFNVPPAEDWEAWSYITQVMQARAIELAVDHLRARKFGPPPQEIPLGYDCGGALFWQFNDCWPVASWSCLDYGHEGWGRSKALHFYAQRFFAPIRTILIPRTKGSLADIELHATIVNDTRKSLAGRVTLAQHSFDGQALHRHILDVQIEPNGVTHLPVEATRGAPRAQTFWHMQFENAKVYRETFYFADSDKILELPPPELGVEVHPPADAADSCDGYILVRSATVVRDLMLSFAAEVADKITLHDNFVTLAAGKSAMLPIATTLGLDVVKAAVRLRHAGEMK